MYPKKETNMAYTMTTTITKPTGAPWWNTAFPDKAAVVAAFCKNYAGVVSATAAESSPTTWQNTIVFTDKAASDAFLGAAQTHPDFVHRKNYFQANGITVKVTFA
jgi:hypothetical protein